MKVTGDGFCGHPMTRCALERSVDSPLSHSNHLASCQGSGGGERVWGSVSGDWRHWDPGIASWRFLDLDGVLTARIAVSRLRVVVKMTHVSQAVNSASQSRERRALDT